MRTLNEKVCPIFYITKCTGLGVGCIRRLSGKVSFILRHTKVVSSGVRQLAHICTLCAKVYMIAWYLKRESNANIDSETIQGNASNKSKEGF